MAEVDDVIIPVRLDLEHDQWRIKDTFMWNISDSVVTPEMFARSLCEDFAVPPGPFVPKITAAVHERVREFQSQVMPLLPRRQGRAALQGKLEPEGESGTDGRALFELFERVKKQYDDDADDEGSSADEDEKMRDATPPVDGEDATKADAAHSDTQLSGQEEQIETPGGVNGDVAVKQEVQVVGLDVETEQLTEAPMTVDELMEDWGKQPVTEDDLRILIKVDIIVGTQNLSDMFEWDLNSSVTPEEFAECYTKELGLSSEFT